MTGINVIHKDNDAALGSFEDTEQVWSEQAEGVEFLEGAEFVEGAELVEWARLGVGTAVFVNRVDPGLQSNGCKVVFAYS